MGEGSDFALLDAWATGDRAAAQVLFARHFDAVYRFFRNKSGEHLEDLVQDTFVACIEARERFRRDASFRTFLFATARNVLCSWYRKRRKTTDPLDFERVGLSQLSETPSKIIARKEEQRVLLEALRLLPLDYQIALELYHWEGMTGPELTRVLGLSEPAVRSRLHRAKLELRRQIDRIEASDEVLRSTLLNLEKWARSLRDVVATRA